MHSAVTADERAMAFRFPGAGLPLFFMRVVVLQGVSSFIEE
jgi:hypothetical protein